MKNQKVVRWHMGGHFSQSEEIWNELNWHGPHQNHLKYPLSFTLSSHLSWTYPALNILRSSFKESQLDEKPCLAHGSVALWQCEPDMKVCWWIHPFFMTRNKNCTCLPSIADRISLNVAWNSPMKSCFPFESQSHTVHWRKGYEKWTKATIKTDLFSVLMKYPSAVLNYLNVCNL